MEGMLLEILGKSKDLIFTKDHALRYQYVNNSYATLLGKTPEEIAGKTDEELVKMGWMPEDFYVQCNHGNCITLESGSYYAIEKKGMKYFRVSKECIEGGILCIARDITDEMEVVRKAEIDELTGLYNRSKFASVMRSVYRDRIRDYYLILIDLDNLREVNNAYGHAQGDAYLKLLGYTLEHVEGVTFFRIGGDEFAGIAADNMDIYQLMDKIMTEIESFELDPKLTISAGIKRVDKSQDYTVNYEETDKLLYEVKRNGKNGYLVAADDNEKE